MTAREADKGTVGGKLLTVSAFLLNKERTSTQLLPVPTCSEICFSKHNDTSYNTKGLGHRWSKLPLLTQMTVNTCTDFSMYAIASDGNLN